MSETDSRHFLRFNNARIYPGSLFSNLLFIVSYFQDVKRRNERLERCICWANPSLLPLLSRKRLTCFFDGTFKCVPSPFKQLLILMVHDTDTSTYSIILFDNFVILIIRTLCSCCLCSCSI